MKTTNDLFDEISKETGWPVDVGLTDEVDAMLDDIFGAENRPDSYAEEFLTDEIYKNVKETILKLFKM